MRKKKTKNHHSKKGSSLGLRGAEGLELSESG
jgi:hypothetical protein